jgi:large subunit ribosomal protein L11
LRKSLPSPPTAPTKKIARQVTLELEAGNAAMVDIGAQPVATMSRHQLREVAERKLPDLNTDDVEAAMRRGAGTAWSTGVLIADT